MRQNLRDHRRNILDSLYSQSNPAAPESRALEALPLVVAVLDPRRPDDRTRLELFAADLDASGCGIIKNAIPSDIKRLADQLITLLEWYVF